MIILVAFIAIAAGIPLLILIAEILRALTRKLEASDKTSFQNASEAAAEKAGTNLLTMEEVEKILFDINNADPAWQSIVASHISSANYIPTEEIHKNRKYWRVSEIMKHYASHGKPATNGTHFIQPFFYRSKYGEDLLHFVIKSDKSIHMIPCIDSLKTKLTFEPKEASAFIKKTILAVSEQLRSIKEEERKRSEEIERRHEAKRIAAVNAKEKALSDIRRKNGLQ